MVTVSDPPIFLKLHKFHARDLARPKAVQVRRTPVAADKTDIGKGTNYLLWPPDGNEPPQERPAIHEKTLFGTIPGRKYRVECEMEFESGKSLKKIKYFTAKKPQCTCYNNTTTLNPRNTVETVHLDNSLTIHALASLYNQVCILPI